MDQRSLIEGFRAQTEAAIRRMLSEQDRNPCSSTNGCFDRRYWAWKLADTPDAALQRNVHALAIAFADPASRFHRSGVLHACITAALRYTWRIQSNDGSFDQVFTNERSFSVTAFLLNDLLGVAERLGGDLDGAARDVLVRAARRASDFLCRHEEGHGVIANHQAAAALGLALSARQLREPRYAVKSASYLDRLLTQQSSEGWFLEYEGADPGYQTLCVYYLAQLYRELPSQRLRRALESSLEFLAFFVHPDGTFAGEYGSRRTALYHPGGIALLSRDFPLAHAIATFMGRSICAGLTTTLNDIDAGNLAPLLMNYLLALDAGVSAPGDRQTRALPHEVAGARNLPAAGLFVRSTPRYYAIFGASNGGVLKVFDREASAVLWDDGGYVAELSHGPQITSQITDLARPVRVGADTIEVSTEFGAVLQDAPTPWKLLALRAAALTLMRSASVAEFVKRLLVRLLITRKRYYPMRVNRRVRFAPQGVTIEDEISKGPRLQVARLYFGRPFTSIHMASANYFGGASQAHRVPPPEIDISLLNAANRLCVTTEVLIPARVPVGFTD